MSATDRPASPARSAVPVQRLTSRLPRELRSPIFFPGDAEYDALVTPWNLAARVRPAAVIHPHDAEDVAAAVRRAAALGMRVSVQCTGHGAHATYADTLLIQTGALDECTIHAGERWARVGAGVKWKRVVDAAAPYGLAPLNGSSTDVGVVGYTTGGGTGPMARTYGMASDRVRAVEAVTGDGVLRRATPESDGELFWGLRGGKGALGIVTAIEFDLVEQPTFYGGAFYVDGADAAAVLHTWRTWCQTLPEQATTSVALLQLPPLPGVPPELAGRLTLAVRFVYTGEPADGERLLQPLRAVTSPLLDGIGVLPYAAIDAVHADPVDPMPATENAQLLTRLPAEAIDGLLRLAGPGSGSPQAIVEVRQLGGAISRPGRYDSAFCHRDAAFLLLAIGVPVNPWVDAHGRLLIEAMSPWSTGARLPNFGASADPAITSRCYTPAVLDRLRRAATHYDPAGVLVARDAVA